MADLGGYLKSRMTPPSPEYRRGAGQPGQLPYGEAQGLNQASAGIPAQAPAPLPSPPPARGQATSVGGQGSPSPEPPFAPTTDEEKFLFGQTQRPREPVTPLPVMGPQIERWLPFLYEAARAPGASRQLRALALQAAATFGPA